MLTPIFPTNRSERCFRQFEEVVTPEQMERVQELVCKHGHQAVFESMTDGHPVFGAILLEALKYLEFSIVSQN